MLNDKLIKKLSELLTLSLEGNISKQQFEEFQTLTSDNPEAVSFCVDFTTVWANLRSPSSVFLEKECDNQVLTPETLDDLMTELAKHERTAPTIEIPKEESPRELIQKVVYPKMSPRHVNKFSLYTAIISVAAMAFAIIYVQIAPPPATTVATITDSINAQWAQSDHSADIGSELWNNEGTRWLHKGIVKIEFDYGAEIIIEGPTGFEMIDAEKMILHSGRLYATVPKSATGFTVQTPYSTIIDLGTEFGVKVDHDGTTDVHMLKGKASLIPGASRQKGDSRELLAGQANRVDTTGEVSEIQIRKRSFVRKIDSETGLFWRGEGLNLADVVGGGDGFGSGSPRGGIHAKTGILVEKFRPQSRSEITQQEQYRYNGVAGSAYIDGVFVPNDKAAPLRITSQGHELLNCPVTSGDYYNKGIINASGPKQKPGKTPSIRLNGKEYGTRERPAIEMRRNKGITFDLEAIRTDIPGSRITRFRALAGISDSVLQYYPDERDMQATFMVLVDDEVRFERSAVTPKSGGIPIDLKLDDNDRFLTLITAYKKVGMINTSVFAEAVLELE